MSGSVGSTDFEVTAPSDPGGSDPGGGGPGGTSYDPWNSGPPGGGWTSSGPTPAPPPGVANPKTGRETPNATIQLVSIGGNLIGTGTPQQLLDRLPSLLSANAAFDKNYAGNPAPEVGLPGGTYVKFASTADLQNYLTRSATPVVPTATVAATFQGVMGRPPSAQETSQAESAFDTGQSLAAYRASLAASPETAGTLRGVSLQVLGRDMSTAELGAYQAQLTAGKTIDALRSDLSQTPEATNGVKGLYQSVLGRAASAPDTTQVEARLAQGGSQADVRQALATSQEAGNAVISAFEAELGRAPSAQNVTDAQGSLAAPGGSLDGVRAYLSTTQEAHDDVAAAFQNELGRPATEQNIADLQHSLAAAGGSLDGVRSYLATTPEAAAKLNATFQSVMGRAAQPSDTASMQSILARGETVGDVRATLAMSPAAAAQITVTYQGACGQAPSQDTVQCGQSLLALGVPSTDVQSIVASAAKSTTAPPDANGNPAEQHGLLYHFFDDLWNTATQQIPNDVAGIISDFVKDPAGTAQRLGPSLGGFGAVAGEVPSIVQGLYGGLKLLGATPSTPANIETERQRLASLIHQRNLGTDPATRTFRANEATTGIRLEQQIGRPLSRYLGQGADYVDSLGTTYDPVGPVPPQFFNTQSFTNQIVEHLNKQGLDRTVIDMTGAPADQINSVNTFLSGLTPQQLSRIIKLGF